MCVYILTDIGNNMARREIPLFIFDLTRTNGMGEVDFVVCTSNDYGFIASFSFEENVNKTYVTDKEIMLTINNNVGLKLTLVRYSGSSEYRVQEVRSLMRKAYKLYEEKTSLKTSAVFDKDKAIKYVKTLQKIANQQFLECSITDMQTKIILNEQVNALSSLLNYIENK